MKDVVLDDNDLVPITASPTEQSLIVKDFRRALDSTGLVVPMATTNLFGDAAFKDGAYTSQKAEQLKAAAFDREALGARALQYEELDQLTVELLLTVR